MDCVFLGKDVVVVEGGRGCCGDSVNVRRCGSPDQSSEYCCADRVFEGQLHGYIDGNKVGVVSCDTCPFKTYPVNLPPNLHGESELHPVIRRWLSEPHNQRPAPLGSLEAVVVNCNGYGYGDAIALAWVAEGHKNKSPKLILAASGDKQKLLSMLNLSVIEPTEQHSTPSTAVGVDMNHAGLQPRMLSLCQGLGIEHAYARPTVTIAKESLDWCQDKLSGSVISICPKSAHKDREWQQRHWERLHDMLQLEGHTVVICGDESFPRNSIKVNTWQLTAAAMKMSRIVITNDSGPMHMAGTLDVPTIALLGPTTDGICNHMPSVIPLSIERRKMACVGCWFRGAYYIRSVCGVSCAALESITPEQVMERVHSEIGVPV